MNKSLYLLLLVTLLTNFVYSQALLDPGSTQQKLTKHVPDSLKPSTDLPDTLAQRLIAVDSGKVDELEKVRGEFNQEPTERLSRQRDRISRDAARKEFMERDRRVAEWSDRSRRYQQDVEKRRQRLEKHTTSVRNEKERIRQQLVAPEKPTLDSATLAKGQQRAETELEQAVTDQMDLPEDTEAMDLRKQMQKDLTGYKGYSPDQKVSKQAVQEKIQQRIEQLGDGYEEVIAENIKESKKEMQKQKRKFKDLPSSQEASKNKLKPLAQLPTRERLRYGTNFRIIPGNTTQVSLSPELSYLLYPKVYIGVGVAYQFNVRFEEKNASFSETEEHFSTRFFTQYLLPKGFYAHGEYVWLPDLNSGETQSTPPLPSDKFLLGIGKSFHVKGRVKGYLQLLYNFNHEPLIPGSRQWEYRFGFTFTQKKNE